MARKSKERDRAYWDKWYAENRERVLEKRKAKKTPEERREFARKWREENRERYNAYHRAYRNRKKEEKLDKTEEL